MIRTGIFHLTMAILQSPDCNLEHPSQISHSTLALRRTKSDRMPTGSCLRDPRNGTGNKSKWMLEFVPHWGEMGPECSNPQPLAGPLDSSGIICCGGGRINSFASGWLIRWGFLSHPPPMRIQPTTSALPESTRGIVAFS